MGKDEIIGRPADMSLQEQHRGKDRRKASGKEYGDCGGGGGSSSSQSRTVSLSKALSRLLRHQAESAGITLDAEGYARLDRVLQWGPLRTLQPTLAEICDVVRDSDKQRFALKPVAEGDQATTDPGRWFIRANQGHSIKIESSRLLRPIVLRLEDTRTRMTRVPASSETDTARKPASVPVPVPATVVHGTYFAFWPDIVAAGGLRPMRRRHVHCSTGVPGGDGEQVVSGMRADAELLVFIDVEASMREMGLEWWLSENGVVLSEGDADGLVPLRFFREVRGRTQGVGVLWKDGEKVADLPEGIELVVPRGKQWTERGSKGRGRGGKRGC